MNDGEYIPLLLQGDTELGAELYRHKKTRCTYEVICNATAELTGELLVIYRNTKTGDRWARPAIEFNDGRFERVAPNVELTGGALAPSSGRRERG